MVTVPGSSGSKEQEMWPDHCVRGTRGAEVEDGVKERVKRLGGVVVRKVSGGGGGEACGPCDISNSRQRCFLGRGN